MASVTGPREMREVCPNLESSSTKQMVSDFWVGGQLGLPLHGIAVGEAIGKGHAGGRDKRLGDVVGREGLLGVGGGEGIVLLVQEAGETKTVTLSRARAFMMMSMLPVITVMFFKWLT